MASELVQAQIAAKKRLQQIVAAAVAAAWAGLPHYDQAQVDEFLSAALPITAAANRQAVMLTVAFLARSLGTAPVGVDAAAIIAGIRNGATPEEVYKRPFVTVWAALGRGTPWADAVKMGSDRAVSAAVTDVQLSFTHTLVSGVDDLLGSRPRQSITYQRVPDDGACEFCETCADQVYYTEDLLPIHSGCGCGVEVLTDSGSPAPAPDRISGPDGLVVAVQDHGELGPVLTNAADHFTGPGDLPVTARP